MTTRRRPARTKATPAPAIIQPRGSSYATLLDLDDRLAAHGVPRLSKWWRALLREWYRHPTALVLAVCAGRGSAKSDALYKVALNETLHGAFDVPAGERHWASLTSIQKEEAAKGVAIISARLAMLEIRHSVTDGLIELEDLPRGIRVTAASVSGTSGWRSFFDGADEVGKWRTEGAVVVDAAEVLASKRAMTATHENARHMLVSTPFLDSGPFYEIITAGSDDHTIVGGPAPTWIATDGRITEAQTRRLEKNENKHAREYGAQFAVEWEAGYFKGLIEPCLLKQEGCAREDGAKYALAVDPAFENDNFVGVVAHHEADGTIIVDCVEVFTPPDGAEKLTPTAALEMTKELAKEYGVRVVRTDQHHFASLNALAQRIGLHLICVPWTVANKNDAFERVRTLMRDGKLLICNDRGLKRELAAIGTRLMPSGYEKISARSGYTDDRVSAMVMAVLRATELPARVETPRPARRNEDDHQSSEGNTRDLSAYDGRGGRQGPHFPRNVPNDADVREVPVSYTPASADGPASWSFGPGARKPGGGGFGSGGFGDYG